MSIEDEAADVVPLLMGSAVAKRFGQLMPDHTEEQWFAVALAAKDVWDVIEKAVPDGDPLEALDEFFELESMLGE